MSNIVKTWTTQAGLVALIQEGKGTYGHVGVPIEHKLALKRKGDATVLKPDINAVLRHGLSRAGTLNDSGLTDEQKLLWWFTFDAGADARIVDIERDAEALARVLQA